MTVGSDLRAADEVAAVRRRAQEHLELVGLADEYSVTRVRAIEAALDWVEGRTVTAPISGEVVRPTGPAVYRESVRAGDAQDVHRRRRERATWPGVICETLQWVTGSGPAPI